MGDQSDERGTHADRDIADLKARGGPFVEAVESSRTPMLVANAQAAGNRVIYVNRAFLKLLGYEREDEVLGEDYLSIAGRHVDREVKARIEAALASRSISTDDLPFRARDGREVWVSQHIDPMEEDGRVVRHFASFYDITERVQRERALKEDKETLERRVATRTRRLQAAKEKLEEEVERRRRTEATLRDALSQGQEDLRFRDFLIREVNHRTKNALQVSVALLQVQASRATPEVQEALETATQRLLRIGEVHGLLTYQGGAPDSVDFPSYLRDLCQQMAKGMVAEPGRVEIEVVAEEEATWGADLVVSLGLIVGEALTNALKYAFPDGREGQVRMVLRAEGGGLMRLCIEDDGVGLPEARREGSLGLRLIDMLARQIRGTAKVGNRSGGKGTVVTVTFPDPNQPPG
jgi:PAS domain S-box-containing protein